jgi:peptidoglycan/xylan/chitin deacetylase (PgdA/CDA1 family)
VILLAVNYHDVVSDSDIASGPSVPVTVSDLTAQLEILGGEFEFVSLDDLLAALGGGPLPSRACLVCFDDGLRSQFELALPVLDGLGIPGAFFACGLPLAEQRALIVHKLRHVRSHFPDSELLDLLGAEIPRGERALTPLGSGARAAYPYDRPTAAVLKYALNHVLSPTAAAAFVDRMFQAVVDDEPAFCERLYMGAEQLAELDRTRHGVGNHGYAHRPAAGLAPRELEDDLELSARRLEAITGRRPVAISYPHGVVTDAAVRLAVKLGHRLGLTTRRAINRSLDAPLRLARLDANDAPGGRRPLFEVRGGEVAMGA